MKINNINGIVAKGYDLTEFFNGKAIKGREEINSKYDGKTFLFDSIANKNKFEKTPEQFLPQYGGYCAIAMSEGKAVDPNPKSYLIEDGKLYFFTRLFFGIIDAKRQWVKSPIEKRKLADAEWEKIK